VAEGSRTSGRRIWIVNHYANPPDRPAGTRHFDLARRLVIRGDEVTIFAAGFSHMTGREERLSRGRLFRSARYDGVRFVWLRTVPYLGNTWRRQLNMLSFLLVFIVVQSRYRAPDSIIGSTVHPFAALGAWFVARIRRATFLFEIRDLWPQTLVDLGAIRVGSPGERLLRALETFLVRRAAAVITLLPGVRDYLSARGLRPRRLAYLPNGVDLASFDRAARGAALQPDSLRGVLDAIRRLRSEGRFVVGYVGSFGRVNQVEVIIRAAAIVEERSPGRVGVVLVGDGPEARELEALAAAEPAVTVCPAIPRHAVPDALRGLDATVLHATATPVYRYGISFNKLFDYMAAQRPIVFACDSAYDPVALSNAGMTVRPDDPEALATALLHLAGRSPEERMRMGSAARAYVAREHNIEQLASALDNLLESTARIKSP
jgi:glycosyltransferase involved in cell wall biosynthesis